MKKDQDIKMWKDADSYANSKEIVSGLNVHTSNKEEHFQNVFQIV